MNAGGKLAVYGAALVVVFAASAGVGAAVAPVGLSNAEPPAEHSRGMDTGDGLPGLATATDEFTLIGGADTIAVGSPTTYTFSIHDDEGPVVDFDLEQTKRMHMIVVRRDFTEFVHLHPTMASDGTWSTPLTLDTAGVYRVYADFMVDGDKHTLGADMFVPGDFQPRPLPGVSATGDAGDGYQVEMIGHVVAGEESVIEFVVRHDGEVVTDLRDYLGAKGHLVALRDGDLAYLHVHPEKDRLLFEAEFPTAGTYRLFLQFDHGRTIRTGELTVDAQEAQS
jgi:hypothetical protein